MGDVASFVALLQYLVDGVGLHMDRERITREATVVSSQRSELQSLRGQQEMVGK